MAAPHDQAFHELSLSGVPPWRILIYEFYSALRQESVMQVELPMKCGPCGKEGKQSIRVDASSFEWKCPGCGATAYVVLDLDLTIGFLLVERSRYELQEKSDYALSITMAAFALDCELSRLFIKWTRIADLVAGRQFDAAKCERELKRLKFIPKFKAVAEMLYPGGIEAYVQATPALAATIQQKFPSLHIGSLAEDFHKAVMKPRNAIAHEGDLHFDKKDAERCLSIASFGLNIFRDMDLERRKLLI